jgi:hypothetical protein
MKVHSERTGSLPADAAYTQPSLRGRQCCAPGTEKEPCFVRVSGVKDRSDRLMDAPYGFLFPFTLSGVCATLDNYHVAAHEG